MEIFFLYTVLTKFIICTAIKFLFIEIEVCFRSECFKEAFFSLYTDNVLNSEFITVKSIM